MLVLAIKLSKNKKTNQNTEKRFTCWRRNNNTQPRQTTPPHGRTEDGLGAMLHLQNEIEDYSKPSNERETMPQPNANERLTS
jgi:hypothetical protein